jgi:hypothetical protein
MEDNARKRRETDPDSVARAIIETSRGASAAAMSGGSVDSSVLARAGVSETDYAELLRSFESVPAKKIDEIVELILRLELETHGFEAITPRKWVKSTAPPIRPIFELSTIGRGPGLLSPRWGFSLDYVPHRVGSSVKWHRTPKTALFDVCNDPLDASSELPSGSLIMLLYGPAVVRVGAADVLPRAVARALEFWSQVSSEADLPAVFDHLKERPVERFGFYNHVQHPLAYAFTLARLGRPCDLERELQAFLDLGVCRDVVLPRLRALLEAASKG